MKSMVSERQMQQGMSDRVFAELTKLVYRHSRIFLLLEKKNFLSSRLAPHKRELKAVDWEQYLDLLMRSDYLTGIETVIEAVSTNHTYFFREKQHFERLSHDLLLTLFKNNPAARSQLKCWSAAASSGEEAYTLAITLAEFGMRQENFNWFIHATDISRRILTRAHESIYDIDSLNLPAPELLSRYFRRGTGPFEGQCKVKAELIQKVTFAQANIFQDRLPVPDKLNIIFCRNVLIYFDQKSQQELIHRLEGMLEPGGLLMIGHSESLFHIQHKLQQLGGGIFRRPH